MRPSCPTGFKCTVVFKQRDCSCQTLDSRCIGFASFPALQQPVTIRYSSLLLASVRYMQSCGSNTTVCSASSTLFFSQSSSVPEACQPFATKATCMQLHSDCATLAGTLESSVLCTEIADLSWCRSQLTAELTPQQTPGTVYNLCLRVCCNPDLVTSL